MDQQQQFPQHLWPSVVGTVPLQQLAAYAGTPVIALPGNLLATPISGVSPLEATGMYLHDQHLQGHPVFVSSGTLSASNGQPAVVVSVSGQDFSQIQLKQEQQHQQTLDLYLVNEGKGKRGWVGAVCLCVCLCGCGGVCVCVCVHACVCALQACD